MVMVYYFYLDNLLTLCAAQRHKAKKNPTYKTTYKMAQPKTHYIGDTFSIQYSLFQLFLEQRADSACFFYSENNQSIVYTHYINLSLIGSLPHRNRHILHLYVGTRRSQLWRYTM